MRETRGVGSRCGYWNVALAKIAPWLVLEGAKIAKRDFSRYYLCVPSLLGILYAMPHCNGTSTFSSFLFVFVLVLFLC